MMKKPFLIKKIGFEREYKALDMLAKKGYICYRVPMSNLPFDIICIDPYEKVLRLIEVKSPKSRLSQRQLYFKQLIEKLNISKVIYEVMVIE